MSYSLLLLTLTSGQIEHVNRIKTTLGALLPLPSYATYWEGRETYSKLDIDFSYREDAREVFRAYRKLADISTEDLFTLWLAYCHLAERMEIYSVPKASDSQLQIAKIIYSELNMPQAIDLGDKIITLYWLMYEVPEGEKRSPWMHYGAGAVFAPSDFQNFSAPLGEKHRLMLPRWEDLKDLKRRTFN